MPRRGLFQRARLAGLFEPPERHQYYQLNSPTTHSTIPSHPMDAEQVFSAPQVFPVNIEPEYDAPGFAPEATTPTTINIPEIDAARAWAHEDTLELQEQPVDRIYAPAYTHPILNTAPAWNFDPLPEWDTGEGRFHRFFNHLFRRREHNPVDFYSPPPKTLSWSEVRAAMPDQPEPEDPAIDAQFWESTRFRIGLRPLSWSRRFPRAAPPAIAATAPILINTPNGPVFMHPPAGPPPNVAAAAPYVMQTPEGPAFTQNHPFFHPPPRPAGQLAPLPSMADHPLQQWNDKHTAAVALLAGLKLMWNAASSAWEVMSMAWDQTVKDNMKIRDDYNQHMAALARYGYYVPGQPLYPPPESQFYTPTPPGAWV
ncbi:hypothetical protein Dda_1550 [Drechslerella dactyloides]|uniref:Uncharacterized protein n=1 Tax=Drechslerella dactyloides TaxID=74499 RepID=A0AAD6J6C7_DREDA|nr:hypothetical protein Dda_1550 [Drechslerella dactyloides]